MWVILKIDKKKLSLLKQDFVKKTGEEFTFYSPKMNGEWKIKSIIKAIPDCPVSYDGQDNIGGGDEAQLAWFIYTDKKTNNDQRKEQIKNLLNYCAKDTLALYYLIKFLLDKSIDQ